MLIGDKIAARNKREAIRRVLLDIAATFDREANPRPIDPVDDCSDRDAHALTEREYVRRQVWQDAASVLRSRARRFVTDEPVGGTCSEIDATTTSAPVCSS